MCEKKLSYTVFGVGEKTRRRRVWGYVYWRATKAIALHPLILPLFPGRSFEKTPWRPLLELARARSFLPVRPTFFFLRVFHGWNRVECIIHPSYVCYVYNIFILAVCRFLVLCSRAGRLRSSTLQTGLRQRVPIPGPPESWSRNQNRRTPQDDEVHSNILLFLLLLFLRVYIMGKPEWHKQNKTNRNK